MSVVYVCDGCGKQAPGYLRPSNISPDVDRRDWDSKWFKPRHWFEREDDDGQQHACSRACIDKAAEKSGKTGVVLPV